MNKRKSWNKKINGLFKLYLNFDNRQDAKSAKEYLHNRFGVYV